MKCAEFREWMRGRIQTGAPEDLDARAHAGSCPSCDRLLRLDQAAEQTLRAGLSRVAAPAGLQAGVKLIAAEKGRERKGWRWLVPAASGAALAGLLLLLLVFKPFGPRLDSIERIAALAEKSHVAAMAMQFQAAQVADVPGWFRNRLAFDVRMPDLAGRGLTLLGGRKCSLGAAETAYLFYSGAGKRYSLFVLPARAVSIPLEEGKAYRYPLPDREVEVWREKDTVYILIG